MKKTLTMIAPAILALGVVSTAQAATVTTKPVTLTQNGSVLQGTLAGKVGYATDFTFTVNKALKDVNVSIASSTPFTSTATISLFQGTTLLFKENMNILPGVTAFDFSDKTKLVAGSYDILVSGSGSKNNIYSGSLKVSPVPLPAALPMFGGALLGLGALARRRKAAKSV